MRASSALFVALVACHPQDSVGADANVEVVDADVRPPDALYIDPGPAICGPDPVAPSLPSVVQSAGSRLVPRALVDADGLTVAWAIHDTLLDLDCKPQLVGTTTRCVPTTTVSGDFVELTGSLASLTTNIAVRQWHGADGSSFVGTELYDLVHGVTVSRGDTRLLPPRVQRLLLATRTQITRCFPMPYDDIFSLTNDSDGAVLRYLTDDHDVAYQVTQLTGTLFTCHYGDAPPQLGTSVQTFLAACNTVPADAWPLVTTLQVGTGRLSASVASTGGVALPGWLGAHTLSAVFTDTSLGITCAPGHGSDGSLRCLPTSGGVFGYADAGCTQQIIVDGSFATPTPYLLYSASTLPIDSRPQTVYAFGASRGSVPWYSGAPQSCNVQPARQTYEVGPVVPPSTFAAFEVRDYP